VGGWSTLLHGTFTTNKELWTHFTGCCGGENKDYLEGFVKKSHFNRDSIRGPSISYAIDIPTTLSGPKIACASGYTDQIKGTVENSRLMVSDIVFLT
jgi:hypothetical protein